MAITIVPLAREHRALLKAFRNQHVSLTEYLQRYALRHATKDLLARTFVALDRVDDALAIAGYFSLAPTSLERASVTPLPSLDRLPRFPIPGVLLARLAVDSRVQGQGLGRYLFEQALGLTLQLAKTGPVTFRIFVTDAIDGAAVKFYQRFGLTRLGSEFPCRMAMDIAPLLAA